jgi:acyl-CoA synthetase (AMP-forming)/AMP-acid ligase II
MDSLRYWILDMHVDGFRFALARQLHDVDRLAWTATTCLRFGLIILEGYGMTETASTATFNISATERRPYSVGKPIWGTQTQVWGDDDRPLPPGPEHVGEIVTRGAHVMKGYLNRPEATAGTFTGDWLRTGDLGYFDQDGFLFLVSRKKELIIRGGYNVYPSEIENVLHGHPAVAEAAVVGIPDARLGEEVMAVIIRRPAMALGEPELVAYTRQGQLGGSDRAPLQRGVRENGQHAVLGQQRSCARRFVLAAGGQVGVGPAGEHPRGVPLALPVPQHEQAVGHGPFTALLARPARAASFPRCIPGSRRHRWRRSRTGRRGSRARGWPPRCHRRRRR